ncbi:MAG: vanadium-dependent haloperoxidase [Burkholderiales bacterium]
MKTAKTMAVISSSLFFALAPAAARADAVLAWNATAADLPIAAPPVMARVMAAMHGAMFDSVNSIEGRHTQYRFAVTAPTGASAEAAAAGAAHGVLVKLVPAQKTNLDNALAASLRTIADGQSKDDGVAIGKGVADQMASWRAGDRFDAKASDNPGTDPGRWQRTPPAMAPGVLPQLGGVVPFAIKTATQFPVSKRPLLASAEFARDYQEVKTLGGRNSSARTADQTAVALFWSGNEVPIWNAAARAASQARKLSLIDNARLFALMHMAGFDAAVVAFKVKYTDNDWRPITAIRNSAKAPDPNWESLLVTPPHPEFPSGHCILSGAYEKVLRDFFQSDEVRFSHVYPPGLGTMRSYTSFSQIAREVEDARVWGGIHFRSTDEQSTELGRTVGAFVMTTQMRPR